MTQHFKSDFKVKRPVMVLCLVILGGCAGALLIGALFAMYAAAAAVLAAVILAVANRRKICTKENVFVTIALITAAVSLLLFAGADRDYRAILAFQGKEVEISGQVEQVEYSGGQRKYQVRGTLTAEEENQEAVVMLTCNTSADLYLFDHVEMTAFLYEAGKEQRYGYDAGLIKSGEPVLNGYIQKIHLAEQPQKNTIKMYVTQVRQNICDGLVRLLPDYRGNLLAEMTVGLSGVSDREAQDAEELFKTAGISHILVISGAHLMIVANIILLFLKLLGLNERIAAVISSVFVVFYIFIAGAGVGVVRAGIMLLFVFAAKLLGRYSDGLTAMAAAALVLVINKPLSLLSVSMWLSFSASLGILLFSERMTGWIMKKLADWPAKQGIWMIVESFCVSFSAWIATLPVMLLTFNGFSLYAVVINMLIAPLLPVIILSGMGAGLLSIVAPRFFITRICGRIAGIVLAVIKWLAEGVSQIPFAHVECGYDFLKIWLAGSLGILLLVLLLVPGKKRDYLRLCGAISAFTLIVSISAYGITMKNTAEVMVSSLYEGSAVTVEYNGAQVVLARVGKNGDAALLRSHIKAQHGSEVDLFILETDPTTDEMRMSEKALSAVLPKAVILHDELREDEKIQELLKKNETAVHRTQKEMVAELNDGAITLKMPADGVWLISFNEITMLYVTEDMDVLDMKAADADIDVLILEEATLKNANLLRNELTVSTRYYADDNGYAEKVIVKEEERLTFQTKNGTIYSLKCR